ncbi:MAG TPA: hypothetical protein HA257_04740 [Candidatus Methanoperedenaceae archaeon]|nr:hypothetical protein [Candidatus Methanoperedenaceae archaeon]
MKTDSDLVDIKGKKYSRKNLQLLLGRTDIDGVTDELLVIAEAVDDPYRLPFLLDRILTFEVTGEDTLRPALLRVQIDAMLRMNDDLEKFQRRRYVAQVMEKLLYGDLLLGIGVTVVGMEEEEGM